MRHVMIDIETLGVKPGCIILSIGAVEFNNENILDQFWVNLDPLDSEKCGLKVEAGTAMWWLDQSKEAQDALTKAANHPLRHGLELFRKHFAWENVDRVWCNGASFDFPILKAAFEAAGLGILPWAYYKEMDFRTFKNLFSKEAFKRYQVKPSIAHDGLADARAQAMTMMAVSHAFAQGEIKWAA